MNLKTRIQKQLASAQQISPFAGKSQETGSFPWWTLLPSLLIVIAVAVWLWLRQESQETELPVYIPVQYPSRPIHDEEPTPVVTAQTVEVVEEVKADTEIKEDLRRIEGIGPKIASVLQDAGIHTYSDLAASDTNWLAQILHEAGIPIVSPETWPEQAAFAAKSDWDGLKKLQENLRGGRRVS